MAEERFADWLNNELVHAFPNMLGPAQLEFVCHRIEHTLKKNPAMVENLLDTTNGDVVH